MTWQCGDERSSFKMMKSLAKVRNTCRTCATVGKIVQKEKISRNHALSEFLYCAILGLRSPHKKGRLVMVRLREKAEKKRESSSARGEHFQVSPRRIEGRKAHYETARVGAWRTDGRGVHKGRARRQEETQPWK